ncbi:hypothetical protein A0Y59_06455, partial [Campylobacter lari]|nr:hypothetical protein [Campylobacter lari]
MINSTQGENSNSTIKQTFLSLATISFLATCANASITTISDQVSKGSIVISKAKTNNTQTRQIKNSRSITGGTCTNVTTCTISNTTNQTVTISGNNGGTLTIQSGGTINANSGHGIAVNNNANNVTINNAGSIQGGSSNGNNAININSSTINNITNSGIISGNNQNAIMVVNKSTIENLINSGSILGNDPSKGGAIVVKDQGTTIKNLENSGTIIASVDGISVHTQGTVNTIINSGVIQGGKNGILVNQTNSAIDTIINNGVIQGGKNGIFVGDGSTVDTIINTKTIISTGTNPTSYQNVAGGIQVELSAKVKTIDNQGLILTKGSGVALSANSGNGTNIEILKNSGTIKYTGDKNINSQSEGYGQGAGIYVGNLNGIPKIGTIDNSGLMDVYNGMYFALGAQVGTIKNSGSILASKDGIVLGNNDGSKEDYETKIDYIDNTGIIQAKRYGIFIDKSINPKFPFQIGQIHTTNQISGGQAGIYIEDNQKITDFIKLEGSNALIAGNIGIYNKGTIGVNNTNNSVNNNTGNVIDLQDGASIAALTSNKNSFSFNTQGDAVFNSGLINGNINLDKKSNIYGTINNTGTIAGIIKLNNESYISAIKNTGTIDKGISLDNKSQVGSIFNEGKADLELKNESIVGTITNKGDMEIKRDDTSSIGLFANEGNLKNTLENK